MKNLITRIRQFAVWIGVLGWMQSATAQNITRIEYFYDTDPGFGSGTSVSFTPAANVSSLAFSPSIAALGNGFHTLYVRSRDANNKWSLTANHPFIKFAAPAGAPSAGNIVKLEFFIDTDPGFGAGTNVPVTPGMDVSGVNFNVNLGSIGNGFHTLYVRSRDANGKWSLTQNHPFIKFVAPTGAPSAANIVKMEYFIDADPGFGAGTNLPVTPGMDVSGVGVNINLGSLGNGFHTLYVRTKDANGKWSLTQNHPFIKFVAPAAAPSATNIVKMEYFVDTDPGFGAGTDVPVTPGMDVSGVGINISLGSISNGFHTLYVRSRDAGGKWSLTQNHPFIKFAAPTGPPSATNIVKMEYFIDTDPGFGFGANIPVTPSTNINGQVVNVDLNGVANGFHTVYIRSKDASGKWSITNRGTFSGGVVQQPTATVTVNGNSTFCLGAGTYLSANYSPTATYQWIRDNGDINGATSITYTPTQSGNYKVRVTNSAGNATSSAVSITVLPVPTATISANGPLSFCAGNSVTLSVNQTSGAGYQWRVNGGSVGSGGNTSSYVVTQSGIYDVVVTGSNGCATTSAKDTVTVSPAPSANITPNGPTTFCTGGNVTLNANTGSGLTYAWSTGATASSINVTTQNTYRVTVSSGINCSASASVTVTVLSQPSATITPNGPTTFCNGNNVILSANTGSGLSYLWSNSATTSSITVTSGGSYSVTVSNAGCSTPSSPVTVTVNPGPTVNASAKYGAICQGHVDTLTATGATTYAWSPSGSLNASTGATVIATPASNTTYTVTGTTSGCIGTATVTVNVTQNNTSAGTATPNICNGGSATLNASGASTYSWSPSGSLNASTGSSVVATPSSNTTYTVTGTTNTCTSTATVIVNVASTVVPSVTINASQTTVCAGTQVTFTPTPVNGGASPSYQWYKNGVLQTTNNGSYSTTTLTNNDSVWAIMTSNATCPSPATATSNKVHMTVNPSVTPTASINVSQNPICAGDSVTFTASISNGGGAPSYQWKKNNVNVGNGATYGVRPANNDSIWLVLTSNAACASPATATSSKIKMTVNPIVTPTIQVFASQNPSCAGANVTFSASIGNGGNSPGYSWYKNGSLVGNNPTYDDNALANNDSVWCVLTSNAGCTSTNTATSNKIIVSIAAVVTPSVNVTVPSTSVCAGSAVTFTAHPSNGGSNPTYQWYKNGALQAGNTDTYHPASVATGDSVWAVMTSNATCPSPATATSNKLFMTVNPVVVPTIGINASQTTICAGDSVTFTSSITNGGGSPSYQWYKNNVGVGTGATYGTRSLANNDSVWCIMTSNAACPSPASVTSSKIKMTVNPVVTPTITVSATQNPICTGSSAIYNASITNGGNSPGYQWYKNGNTVSGTTSYTDNSPAANDSVWCVLTSNATCASTNTVTSNKVKIVITNAITPSVTISASPSTTVCAGATVTFTATPINGGGSPSYQWYKNGALQSGNTGSYITNSLNNNDSVWCIMTSNAACASPATATSNKVHMTINPVVTPTISINASQTTICAGDSVTFSASVTNGGASPSYQWYRNNISVGSGGAIYGTRALLQNDSVWAVLTSSANCPSPASVSSNKVKMTVNPTQTPTISISTQQSPICEGSTTTFNTTVTNEGNNPTYIWFVNESIVGGNTASYSAVFNDGDSVWAALVSNASCAVPAYKLSSKVYISTTPTVAPSVTITPDQSTVCEGEPVIFTPSPVNGGVTPTYSWYENGVLQLVNTGSFTAHPATDNDSVWAIMASNAVCPLPATATSSKVYTHVLPVARYNFSEHICEGDSYQFKGNQLTQQGVYRDTLSSVNGCDSIVTLSLVVNTVWHHTITASICEGESYFFKGQNRITTDVYRDTLTSVAGCDSFVTLDLTVHPLPVPVIVRVGLDTLKTSAAFKKYKWLYNNTVLSDTTQTIIITQNGQYSVIVTDSATGCSDTSGVYTIANLSIDEAAFINLMIYPNPTGGMVTVKADNPAGAAVLEVRDELGRLLIEKQVQGNLIQEQLDLSTYSGGMYLLSIKSDSKVWVTKRIFKN